jgi:hypothetical protein
VPDFRRDAKHGLYLLKAISSWPGTQIQIEVCRHEGRRGMRVTIVAGEVYKGFSRKFALSRFLASVSR